jgi:plastocyanin
MRTILLLLVGGTACLGLARGDDHSGQTNSTHGPRLAAEPNQTGAKLSLLTVPRTTPFRNTSFFSATPPERQRSGQVRDVDLMDNYFSTSCLFIPVGTTVRFTNRGRHHHSTTCKWLWESGELRPGESFRLTFTRRGTYSFYCRLHPLSMHGTITVR